MTVIISATKPSALVPIFEAIPEALTVYPRWVVWRWTPERDRKTGTLKWTKPPFNARTGARAKSTDPSTWSTFEEAVAAYSRGGWDGIGVMLVDPFSGVDLDNVRDPETETLHPAAPEIVADLDSYVEFSPSGLGLRIFTQGRLPIGWRNKRTWVIEIEMYDTVRYLTATGHHLAGTPTTIEERTDALAALHQRVARETGGNRTPSVTANGGPPGAVASASAGAKDGAALLGKIRASRQGDQFRQLFERACVDGQNHSVLDLQLCRLLAFWTRRDPVQIDRLFRQSALFRPKWDERHYADGRTYGQATIATAIARCQEVYMPRRPRHGEARHSPEPIEVEIDRAPLRQKKESSAVTPPSAARPPFVLVTPPESFVTRYVTTAMRRTDAPGESHVLAALTVLSALAGPRPRLRLAYRADGIRLVLWAMNVVDSTSGRKTTVNEFGLDVIRQVIGEEAILPWKGSPEAFIQAFALRSGQAAILARDEYTGLLVQMKKGGYVAGLAQDFIRAYDGLPIVMARTAKMNRSTGERMDDTDRVRDPYLVKLCAATRTSFIETADLGDVLDGLLARFVFTSGVSEERPLIRMTPQIENAWGAVIAHAPFTIAPRLSPPSICRTPCWRWNGTSNNASRPRPWLPPARMPPGPP
jgi:putative DNA primase/helicase